MITLYNQDFKEALKDIPDNSIDAVITDIPYNISRASNFGSMGREGLDFGEWDKGFDEKELALLIPKIKKGGSIFCFHAFEQYSILLEVFKELECKDRVVWRKPNAMPRNRDRRYIGNIEMGSWYVKPGSPWTFNRQSKDYDESVMTYPVVPGKGRIHPTEKPLELMKEIVLRHSNKGDTILDPFMGSGTTGVACLFSNRSFIGIEREEKYFSKAVKRIKDNSPMTERKNIFVKN